MPSSAPCRGSQSPSPAHGPGAALPVHGLSCPVPLRGQQGSPALELVLLHTRTPRRATLTGPISAGTSRNSPALLCSQRPTVSKDCGDFSPDGVSPVLPPQAAFKPLSHFSCLPLLPTGAALLCPTATSSAPEELGESFQEIMETVGCASLRRSLQEGSITFLQPENYSFKYCEDFSPSESSVTPQPRSCPILTPWDLPEAASAVSQGRGLHTRGHDLCREMRLQGKPSLWAKHSSKNTTAVMRPVTPVTRCKVPAVVTFGLQHHLSQL